MCYSNAFNVNIKEVWEQPQIFLCLKWFWKIPRVFSYMGVRESMFCAHLKSEPACGGSQRRNWRTFSGLGWVELNWDGRISIIMETLGPSLTSPGVHPGRCERVPARCRMLLCVSLQRDRADRANVCFDSLGGNFVTLALVTELFAWSVSLWGQSSVSCPSIFRGLF